MRVANLEVSAWATGRLMITLEDNTSVHIQLSEEESDRVRNLGVEIFLGRQKEIANEIASAKPALLGDFTEVEDVPS